MSPVSVPPVVRHMLLCEDIGRDPTNPKRIAIYGLIGAIRSTGEPPFPLLYPVLCVYLVLAGGRGEGDAQIVGVSADGEKPVFASPTHRLSFGLTDPLDVAAVIFRIRDCSFPQAGLYWIEFRYNGETIAREPLVVRTLT